jgi:orotidine-5'-phosphate decarboxylase
VPGSVEVAGPTGALSFGDRVALAVAATGPLCVGIDPSPALLAGWGLEDGPDGLRAFGRACVEALAGAVPVVKPQVAFFERHGAAGMSALETLIDEARGAGLLVVADAKRGDVESTAEAYAEAWFSGPFAADAVTATAYVGFGALGPMVSAARRTGRGLLVVAASSNPEGRGVQEAVTASGATVEASILGGVADANAAERASFPGRRLGSVGAVVGATRAPGSLPLAATGGVILAPGIGAQGAAAADVAAVFEGCPAGSVLPSVSRALLRSGARQLREEALRLRDDLAAALR